MSTQTITERAAQLAAALAPLAALLGAGNVAGYLTAVASLTQAILDAVEQGSLVLEAHDLAAVQAMQAALQARNDALAAEIAAS